MWVAILRLDLTIPGARSLKDRRQVVKSLQERLISRFGVSCAEVGELEAWTRASLGVAVCGKERSRLQHLAEDIVRYATQDAQALLGSSEKDLFRFGADA